MRASSRRARRGAASGRRLLSRPRPLTCSGSTRMITRCSPGWRSGYSSTPMYFFAIASMCASAPSCVRSATRPADLDVLVGVLHVLHRQRHARVALEVARPGASLGGVQHGTPVLHVDPYRARRARMPSARSVATWQKFFPFSSSSARPSIVALIGRPFLVMCGGLTHTTIGLSSAGVARGGTCVLASATGARSPGGSGRAGRVCRCSAGSARSPGRRRRRA